LIAQEARRCLLIVREAQSAALILLISVIISQKEKFVSFSQGFALHAASLESPLPPSPESSILSPIPAFVVPI
jgi:hypothetical protein